MKFFGGFTDDGEPRRPSSAFLIAVIVGAMLVCGRTAAYAQSTFGSILGTVVDPSGAVIPGAVIHVTNLNDNSTRETGRTMKGSISF